MRHIAFLVFIVGLLARIAAPSTTSAVDYLREKCELTEAEAALVLDDLDAAFAGRTENVDALEFVVHSFAIYDEWTSGVDYVSARPHGRLPADKALCCHRNAVVVAGHIFGAEFAKEAKPLFESWKEVVESDNAK